MSGSRSLTAGPRCPNLSGYPPHVKSNKNDRRDAAAIREAVSRPQLRFVPLKTVESQDIQALHRLHRRLIKERTALVNQIRGLLAERGIVITQGMTKVIKQPPLLRRQLSQRLRVTDRLRLTAA